MLSMLPCPHPPPDETWTVPPISTLTTPYASTPPCHLLLGLQSLCCCGALKLCLQCHPHRPLCLLLSAAYHPYTCEVPSQHSSNVAYHPYACIVPTQHASNACSSLPTCLRCPPHTGLILKAAYDSYTPAAASR
ncbi:hypothetical protein O181_021007 [Austropuccinia psidii MF-1]|uniref:Uncharacterized protein n=1 Tax=Austropuccinia psidii MF-1 TaxID=1389203 RepID=A0A9Q3CEM9_9BASI|nr:hypothetical protein [Austropuccinia psidii MF-1]